MAKHAKKSWVAPEEVHWKIEQEEEIQERFKKSIKPLTKKQEAYLYLIETSSIVFATGAAGVGKTAVAIGRAIEMLNSDRPIQRIIITRPAVVCGRDLGFLPGSLSEKFSPFIRPVIDNLRNFISQEEINERLRDKSIEIVPLALMRGLTFDNCFIIGDELQNAEYIELKMLLTRIGQNSRMVLCGDTKQSDLRHQTPPFVEIIERLKGHPDIAHINFTKEDIVRNGIIRYILERLE